MTLLVFRITKCRIFLLPEYHLDKRLRLRRRIFPTKEKEKMNGLYLFLFRQSRIPAPFGGPFLELRGRGVPVHESKRGGS
jgi:hypothetical protein